MSSSSSKNLYQTTKGIFCLYLIIVKPDMILCDIPLDKQQQKVYDRGGIREGGNKVKEIAEALERHFASKALIGKGGFWVKEHGFISLAKARRITGIKATPREPRARVQPWGDYATIAKINGVR